MTVIFLFSTLGNIVPLFAGEQSFSPLFLCSSFVYELLSISSVFFSLVSKSLVMIYVLWFPYVNLALSLLNFLELLSQCFPVYWGSFLAVVSSEHFFCFSSILFKDHSFYHLRLQLYVCWSFGTVPNINMLFHLLAFSCFSLFLCCAWSPVLFIMVRKLSLGREPGWKKD